MKAAAPLAALALVLGGAAAGAVVDPVLLNDGFGPVPGEHWCPAHEEWHAPRVERFDPLTPGVMNTPPGKVWSPEHGHFHDLPSR